MPNSVLDPLIGKFVDSRYRVDELLARGGMATVYTAVDIRLDRVVALKIMHPELAADPDFVDRFTAEAHAAARLSHPSVVAVFDQGTDRHVVYLVLEYVRGRTLRQLLREQGRLSVDHAVGIMDPVLAALASAHEANLVHRDVKPENILIGDDGQVKVADFGLARVLTTANPATRGLLLGTVDYISPEQALGEPVTPRSDVYSAGIMLFEMLTGRVPHSGPTDFVVVRGHIDNDVPPPSHDVPELPRAVDALVLEATARQPQDRISDAADFRARVRHLHLHHPGSPAAAEQGSAGAAGGGSLWDPGIVPGLVDRDEASVAADEALTVVGEHPPPMKATSVIDSLPAEQAPRAQPANDEPSDGNEGARRRRRWPMVLATVLVIAAAVAVGVGAWWYAEGRFTEAPDLVGDTREAAVSAARDEPFSVEVAGEGERQFSETVPEGSVVATDPEAGTRMLSDSTVTLYLSRGPERYDVPDVGGLTVDEARQALREQQLRLGPIDESYSESVPEGQVIEQDVVAGEAARPDTEVGITVSNGPEPIEIPDVVGQQAEAATDAISNADLESQREEEYSEQVPAGTVISQDPQGGTATRGDTVTIVVSRGPEEFEVPSVRGSTLDEARQALEEAGLEVEVNRMLPDGPGNVLRQSPSFGTVSRGDVVELWVF